MINGIALPMQLHMEKMSSSKGMPSLNRETNHARFGSVLASMSTNDPIISQSEGEISGIRKELTELLEMTTLEEVIGCLEEGGHVPIEVPELIDGHFIIHDEMFINLLSAVVPNLVGHNEFNRIDGNVLSIDVREILMQMHPEALLDKLKELLIQVDGQQPTQLETLSKSDTMTHVTAMETSQIEGTQTDNGVERQQSTELEALFTVDVMTLVTVMKMLSIAGLQTDVTVKEESHLHSIREVLKSLGEFLTDKEVKVQQVHSNRSFSLPFLKTHATVQLTEVVGQSAQLTVTEVKVDGAQPLQESQGNHRPEQLMRELQNVLKRANFGQTGGINRISVKLYPEHLGQLRIELLQTNGLLTARILASNVLGKEMLESQLHQLRQAFLQQNIQVERIDISQMLTETPQHEREQAFSQQFKKQQEKSNDQESHQNEEESMSFDEYMIELEA